MDFEDMCTEVESLHQKIKFIEKHAESVRRRGILAEEQARRRAELLEDAIQEVDASRKENNLLATQLASLQAGIKSFSEEDACHSIRRLYHDLRHWVCVHFGEYLMGEQRHDIQLHEETHVLTVDGIQSHVAALIFTTFWVRFMVGYGPSSNNYLCCLDQEVRELYPNHISRHWRCAMSTAIVSQEALNLQNQQQYIVNQVEDTFSHYSITDKPHRTSQLSDLIRRCVQLKQSLECQDGSYIFLRSHPRMPFRDENMRRLVEEAGSNDTVEYSVWPGLYKILQPGNWAVVEKEIVKTMSSRIETLSMTDESEGQSESQWLEEI